jgi:hypothetical protein
MGTVPVKRPVLTSCALHPGQKKYEEHVWHKMACVARESRWRERPVTMDKYAASPGPRPTTLAWHMRWGNLGICQFDDMHFACSQDRRRHTLALARLVRCYRKMPRIALNTMMPIGPLTSIVNHSLLSSAFGNLVRSFLIHASNNFNHTCTTCRRVYQPLVPGPRGISKLRRTARAKACVSRNSAGIGPFFSSPSSPYSYWRQPGLGGSTCISRYAQCDSSTHNLDISMRDKFLFGLVLFPEMIGIT